MSQRESVQKVLENVLTNTIGSRLLMIANRISHFEIKGDRVFERS